MESLIPSFLGGLLKTSREKNVTLFERLVTVMSGVLTAGFVTPMVISMMSLRPEMTPGVSFGLGYLGLNVVETIWDKFKKEKTDKKD